MTALLEALETLKRFHPKAMDLSMDRVHRLLAELGHPERKLPPVIHVAGTNGKGSTVAFMRAILEAAGYRVHAYTSPHLVSFNERIRVAGRLIEGPALLNLIEEVRGINGDQPITFFEITTAIALLVFSRVEADAVLLETGLGGVMDATNVVDRPAATVITRISYDHTHLLGTTITAIAGEKAGIIKPGVPIVLSRQKEETAIEVVSRRAEREGAPLILYGRDWQIEEGDGLHYEDRFGSLTLPVPALLGAHQYYNAGAAIAALRHAGKFTLTEKDFSQGLVHVEWPGRLQRLTRGPLAAILPEGAELWLDGGHNDSGGEALGEQAAAWAAQKDAKPLSLIFGMLNTKDTNAFLRPLAPYVTEVQAIAIPEEDLSLSAAEAASAAEKSGLKAGAAANIEDALKQLLASGPHRILICGSLYLAGTVLRENS
jgi:dihydrofolate synthase/folylpolyglutamate synthase